MIFKTDSNFRYGVSTMMKVKKMCQFWKILKCIYTLVKEDILMLLELLLHENITNIQKRVFDHVLDLVKLDVKDIAQNSTHSSEQRMLTYLRKYMKSKTMN